jgi:hypothetical protein
MRKFQILILTLLLAGVAALSACSSSPDNFPSQVGVFKRQQEPVAVQKPPVPALRSYTAAYQSPSGALVTYSVFEQSAAVDAHSLVNMMAQSADAVEQGTLAKWSGEHVGTIVTRKRDNGIYETYWNNDTWVCLVAAKSKALNDEFIQDLGIGKPKN